MPNPRIETRAQKQRRRRKSLKATETSVGRRNEEESPSRLDEMIDRLKAKHPWSEASIEASTERGAYVSGYVRGQPIEAVIARKLGGELVLRHSVKGQADIEKLVCAGLPLAAFESMRRSGRFTPEELQEVIPRRTLRHRRDRGERLKADESDKAVRLLRIQTLADQVFGDTGKADKWLRRPMAAFDGKKPIQLAVTEAGVRVVEAHLDKIAWGAAA